MPRALALCLSSKSPSLVPSTSTEFTLEKIPQTQLSASASHPALPVTLCWSWATPQRRLLQRLLWIGGKQRAEGGVERWEPHLPSLQNLPVSPHLAFLGPPVCHTNTSVTPAGKPAGTAEGCSALVAACGKPEMGLNQTPGLGCLQTRRKHESGSGFTCWDDKKPNSSLWLGEGPGLSPISLANTRHQLSVVTLLTLANWSGKLGAGMMSRCSALPACPPSEVCVFRGKQMVPLEKYMQHVHWCPPQPCHPGLVHHLPSATSLCRVLWIYFCIYKYNVRMARSITNNIHDTAVNGARCKVWLPGTLAHAGR